MALESASRFYFEQNQILLAKNYLQNAYRSYNEWGATSKLNQLERKYPQYISKDLLTNAATNHNFTTEINTTSTKFTSGNLDLNSIIKASQSLSGEVNIEKLLTNMMMIVMENAGAEYAVFIKNEDGNYLIQAKGNCDEKSIEVMQSESLEKTDAVPLNVVKYVIRTNKSIVLDNALDDKRYSVNYIKDNSIKSILCQPIIHKNNLVAVLYLENNLSTHVFTQERVETVSILSSQIAVSIENALLYDNLEKKVEQRTSQLQNAKEELEKSHKNITDSIMYANRIQNAVLPKFDSIKNIFPEHFIFYKPRDIVSGDFYYIKPHENLIFIAAADCTGHGVPGAFMSMLGIAIINDLVRRTDIKDSAQLLDELREQVKYSLQQTGQAHEQQDGMDIAFVAIDIESKTCSYAGANNSLWLYRDSELTEFKADRMPVGIYLKERPFTNHNFSLQKDDRLYLFSDGYYSQFKEGTREKMKARRFKELICDIHMLSFEVAPHSL